ncbi:MAG: hypothetical protein ACRDD9_04080, partial [Shewanella sp.]
EGMKTAFYTSLAGLGSSALFMIWMKTSSSILARAQDKFISKLSSEYFEASPVYYLKNISNEGQGELRDAQFRSANAMETMADRMESTRSALSQLGESFNGNVIAEQISTALKESFEATMNPILGSIKYELSTLKDIKEQSQKELVDILIAEMKAHLILPVAESLNKTSVAVNKSNEVAAQLNENIEKVVTSTAVTVETINEFQKETMTKLQEFVLSLTAILNNFKDDTQGAMSTIASEVNVMLTSATEGMNHQRNAFEQSTANAASAFKGMKDSLEAALTVRQQAEKELFDGVENRINTMIEGSSQTFAQQTVLFQGAMNSIVSAVDNMLTSAKDGMTLQRNAFEKSAANAASAFEGMKDSLEAALTVRQQAEKELFDGVENRINILIEGSSLAFKEQTYVLESVGEQASRLMTSAKEELKAGLGDIDTKVKSMSETVQRELEAFRLQYQENLSSYFEQQNDLLENSLSKQRNGLNEVVDNFRNVFENEYKARHNLLQELTAQYEKLEASAVTLERVAKAIGLSEASKMAELQDAANTMSRAIGQLKKEYAQASITFADVTENLPKAMDEYFTRANTSFEGFFKDFDQSASAIHNKLSQAAGYLISAQVQRRQREEDEALA